MQNPQTPFPADIPMRKTIFVTTLLTLSLGQATQVQASQPSDWTHLLTDPHFMPAIKNCLAAHPKSQGPAVVMNVWHSSPEDAGVMTTDLTGRRNECYASKDTGLVSRSKTVIDLPGPLFVSVDQVKVAPQGECIVSNPVFIDQQLQGWVLRQPILNHQIPSACSWPIWTSLFQGEK
jgi:hypothetical protein